MAKRGHFFARIRSGALRVALVDFKTGANGALDLVRGSKRPTSVRARRRASQNPVRKSNSSDETLIMSEGAQGTPILTDLHLTSTLKDVKDLLKSRNRVNLILRELKDENAKLKEEIRQLRDQDIKRIKPGGIVIFNRMVYLPRISCRLIEQSIEPHPLVEQSIERQTTAVLLCLKSLLCDAGTTLEHLLRVSVYLDDLRKEPKMREAWDEFFESEGIPEDVRPVPIVHAVRMLDRYDEVEMTAEAALPIDKRVTFDPQNPTVQEYEVDTGNTISKKTRRSPRKRNREWTQEQMDERIRVKRENTQARADDETPTDKDTLEELKKRVTDAEFKLTRFIRILERDAMTTHFAMEKLSGRVDDLSVKDLEPEPEPEAEPEAQEQEQGEYWTDEDGYQCTADVNAWKETQHGPGWQKYGPLIDAPESCPDNLYVCTVKSNNRTDRYFRLFDETGKLLPFEDCDTKGQRKMNVRQEVLRSKVAVNRYLSAV